MCCYSCKTFASISISVRSKSDFHFGANQKIFRIKKLILWQDTCRNERFKVNAKLAINVVVVLPDPFRGMGAWRKSTETQLSDHAPRSGPEVKNGSIVPKTARRDNQEKAS